MPRSIKSFHKGHWQIEMAHYIRCKFSGVKLEKYLQKANAGTNENLKRYREAEHQIGRFLNMQKILKIMGERNLAGDIVEFGPWQGQGLRLLDLAAYKILIKN